MSAPNNNDEAPNNNGAPNNSKAPNEEDNKEAAREGAEQKRLWFVPQICKKSGSYNENYSNSDNVSQATFTTTIYCIYNQIETIKKSHPNQVTNNITTNHQRMNQKPSWRSCHPTCSKNKNACCRCKHLQPLLLANFQEQRCPLVRLTVKAAFVARWSGKFFCHLRVLLQRQENKQISAVMDYWRSWKVWQLERSDGSNLKHSWNGCHLQ